MYATSTINSFDITLDFSSGTPDYAEGHTTTTTIKGHVDSIKNPKSGTITVDSVGEILMTDDVVMECSGKVIVR